MNRKSFGLIFLIFFIAMTYVPLESYAHEPDHSYIFLRINMNSIEGRFEVGRLDLNRTLGINLSEHLSQSEIDPYQSQIEAYILNNIAFVAEGTPQEVKIIKVDIFNIDEEDDNVRVHFEISDLTEIPSAMSITYKPFFDKSPNHRGMLVIEYHWKAGIIDNYSLVAEVFDANETSKLLNLQDVSIWKGFLAMIKLGIWHIWIGIDHILFLIALVLPAVVRRNNDSHLVETLQYSIPSEWSPVAKFKPAAWYIIKIVTFFTIAHSITLAIASLEVFTLPSKYVESTIAFSIALAAFHNIKPIFKSKEWVVAFVFGLFHGFGFASVLGEKGLGGDFFLLSLLGFNVGVEVGQVVIILLTFPILFLIRTFKIYPKFLIYGSAVLILISLHWSIERLFEINFSISRTVKGLLAIVQPLL